MTAALSPEMKRSNLRFSLAMPLFFMVMFPLCYITALHLPVPNQIPVGVVGAGAAALVASLGPRLGNAVELMPVGSVDQAREMIFQQTIKAAYVPESSQMLVAGADGRVMTQLVPTIFAPVAGGALTTVDVAPLAPGDGNGIGLMFFMLIVCIVGFMTANILGNAAFFLPVRQRIAISAGVAVLTPIVLWLFMGLWLQIIVGSFGQIVAVIALGAVASFTVGLVTTAAVVVLGKWALFPCMLIFVFLNIPSSNSAYPAEIVPPFFGGLSEVHLGSALVGAVRSILYFGNVGVGSHLLTMGIWLVIGVVLLGAAIAWRDRGSSSSSASADATDSEEELDHEVAGAAAAGAGPRLSGRVHGRDGRPLGGARVTVVDGRGTQSGLATADGEGRFEVAGLPGGTFTVIASAPGHAPAAHTATVGGPGADLGSIRLAGQPGRHDDTGTSESSMPPAASYSG
ncbi:carboxypeptidase-like regulatory domain-containing protein [Actinomycetospora termitidis]|uniref:Carboxypeptidase-like regulatory domain-containing protein n=1 Tax=Actinomycetospora termitidis TaxID=3053470 RepID=A0ABT7MER9_9PSEU|nr:carboxypeptidase-like regulatory domain-containing protein [Actinomycetospora sp. Odt1-22]MDL5159166.1 carboxypeptidase-like regulatory domain-containing protein [Actinomycetospora sp. Odt1-22]